MAPVRGKVFYEGKPLEFGSVTFQPDEGPTSRSAIGPDGSFDLTSYEAGPGAAIGRNRVRITCYEGQRKKEGEVEQQGEGRLGKSLIPEKYASLGNSGLTYEVKPDGNLDVVFNLTKPTE